MGYRRLHLDEGFVEYVVDGPEDARELLIFHHGTPSAAVRWEGLIRPAAAAGFRTASYSRAGYGSSPRRAGRSVADEAAVSAVLADRLGYESFYTLGWSGGGPVALACAALLPDRVRAAMALASIAPRAEAGPEWDTFYTPDQLRDWNSLANDEPAAFIHEFEEAVETFGHMTVRRLAQFGPPIPEERPTSVEEISRPLVRSMRRAFTRGYFGYLDDNLAQARGWGFRVKDIRVPVVVRHGELDRLVGVGNGRWLAAAIPGAEGVFHADAGHGTIALPWEEVVRELVEAGR